MERETEQTALEAFQHERIIVLTAERERLERERESLIQERARLLAELGRTE